jgi:hypothetical protein
MKFFSGFSLKNESHFFDEFLYDNDFSVAGFSYGAIKAFEYTQQELQKGRRIDTLQLFSPAFFQSKDKKFKRLQLMSYKRSSKDYLELFLQSSFAPHPIKEHQNQKSTIDELHELLEYQWDAAKLQSLNKQGVNIEVYLGGEDKIIDANAAKELFLNVATVTYIKNANHFLQIK